MRARRILETSIYANDLDAAEAFYGGVLGLERIARDPDRHAFFRCGDSVLLVFNAALTATDGRAPAHGAEGAGHVAFAASPAELDAWRDHLAAKRVALEREVDWPNGARSLYFRDPAGNSVELATPSLWGGEDAD